MMMTFLWKNNLRHRTTARYDTHAGNIERSETSSPVYIQEIEPHKPNDDAPAMKTWAHSTRRIKNSVMQLDN
jgi:hypothetical protein